MLSQDVETKVDSTYLGRVCHGKDAYYSMTAGLSLVLLKRLTAIHEVRALGKLHAI